MVLGFRSQPSSATTAGAHLLRVLLGVPLCAKKDLTRIRSATAGGSELYFHFILHNSFFSLSVRRPAGWLHRLVRPLSLFLSRHQRRMSFHPLAAPSTGLGRQSRWHVAIDSVMRCAEGCCDLETNLRLEPLVSFCLHARTSGGRARFESRWE